MDLLSTDVEFPAEKFVSVAALRIQLTLSSAAVVSVITKNLTGSVLSSSQLQSGSSVTANAAFGWVYLINNLQKYNVQLSAATNAVTGQVDIAEAPLF